MKEINDDVKTLIDGVYDDIFGRYIEFEHYLDGMWPIVKELHRQKAKIKEWEEKYEELCDRT